MPRARTTPHPPPAGSPPAPWFFDTPEQRLSWARRRFFEDGIRPTGVVDEAVLQSWARCLRAGLDPQRPLVFDPVGAGRLHGLLERHHRLLAAAGAELQQLQHSLADTAAVALLLDARGRVLHTTRRPDPASMPVLAAAARPGVDLSELQIGTNAPALAVAGSSACVVRGGEHFAGSIAQVHCAAAAIRGRDGQVAAVLDISTEHGPFSFDAVQVVAWHATAIENQWLLADAGTPMVLRLHLQPAQLDSALVGLVGLDALGRLVWQNAAAKAMLGPAADGTPSEALFGLTLPALLQQARRGVVQRLRLASGLHAWLQAEWRDEWGDEWRDEWRDAGRARQNTTLAAAPAAAATMPAAVDPAAGRSLATDVTSAGVDPVAGADSGHLRERQRVLVQRALQACGGNVSAAARRLGVSRGLVYRHRRDTP